MSNKEYTEEEINWAINELKKKVPNKVITRERAIKLLDKFKEFGRIMTDNLEEDQKSGKLKTSKQKKSVN